MISHKKELLPNIFVLEGNHGYGFRSFCYVIDFSDFSVLIDVSFKRLIPDVRTFPPPKHLILTHRHTRIDEADFEKVFNLNCWLTSIDANMPRRGDAEGTIAPSHYDDPFSGGLNDLGFSFFPMHGHTPGSVIIHLNMHGGVLFVGDSLVGPQLNQPNSLNKPPPPTSDDDNALIQSILSFEPPEHKHILPLHGEPMIDLTQVETTQLWKQLKANLR